MHPSRVRKETQVNRYAPGFIGSHEKFIDPDEAKELKKRIQSQKPRTRVASHLLKGECKHCLATTIGGVCELCNPTRQDEDDELFESEYGER
jgi:hypothetical protein